MEKNKETYNKRIEYIKQTLQERGIDENTQNYVIRFVQMNQELFGNIIDMDKLVKRLTNNMQHGISTNLEGYDTPHQIFMLSLTSGAWDPYKKRIFVSPFYKIGTMISKRFILSRDSTLFHELDHCGTTEYIDESEQEKEEYIRNYIETNGIRSIPDKNEFRRVTNQMYEMNNGKKVISGITGADVEDDIALNLSQLNEGITAYKQEMYDRYNKTKPKSQYRVQKGLAKLIADVIGEEISTHASSGDAMVTVLEGKGLFTISGEKYYLEEGQTIIMPKDQPHSVYGEEKFKMLLVVSF